MPARFNRIKKQETTPEGEATAPSDGVADDTRDDDATVEEPDQVLPSEAIEDLKKEVLSLRETIQQADDREKELREQVLRALADLDNVRKRSRQEREEIAQYGLQNFLQDLLPVFDNLERALSVQADSVDSLKKGVELTLRQLHETLDRHGIKSVESVGQPFDVNLHEAIMRTEPTEECPAGTVANEIQRGYLLRGRLIRPARVQVAQDE